MIYIGRIQRLIIAGVCLLGVLFALPNVLSKDTRDVIPDWLPSQSMNLGLDLQGGAHLLVEVDTPSAIRSGLDNVVEALRPAMRQNEIRVGQMPIQGRSITLRLGDPAQADKARQVIADVVGGFTTGSGGFGGGSREFAIEQINDSRFRVSLTDEGVAARTDRAIEQVIEVLRRRIDELGLREAAVQRQGEDRIVIQLPGEDNPEDIIELIQQQAKMTFHLVEEDASAQPGSPPPPGTMRLPMRDGPGQLLLERRAIVTGENLVDAQQTFDQGQPVVSFRFDAVGGRNFGEATSENVGRRFAIVLDGEIISAPTIRDAILGGSGIITGGFTVQSAEGLAVLLRSGALPAEVQVVEERTVGPGLGQDSIDAGKMASILGLVFVVVFMALSYGRFGLMADVALLLNLILIAGVLSALQATLTLPGIAGIVLTIGMAVDANVLIFERVREESAAGRPPINAVDAGYRRALTTIIDSNLTTFIAAILLFLFGTGPIKGFAVTLSIGLATSMFTAVMVTRLMVVTWLRRAKPAELVV